nr:MAG: capsid protein [Owegonang virus 10]
MTRRGKGEYKSGIRILAGIKRRNQELIQEHKRRKLTSSLPQRLAKMGDVVMTKPSKKDTGQDGVETNMMPGLGPQVWGFPKSLTTKLRYCQALQLTSTSGAVNYNTFRANSIFDPDQTGTGHQPLYHDQFYPVYNNYRVLGSMIKVTFTPLADASDATRGSYNGPWYVGINGTNATSSYSATPETRWEANDSAFAVLNARTGTDGVITLSEQYSPETTLGRPSTDDVVSSVANANPSQQWYWQAWVADESGGTSTVVLFVEIEYTVQYFNLINQAQN